MSHEIVVLFGSTNPTKYLDSRIEDLNELREHKLMYGEIDSDTHVWSPLPCSMQFRKQSVVALATTSLHSLPALGNK